MSLDQELLGAACDGDLGRVQAARAAGASLTAATTPGSSTALHAAAWLGFAPVLLSLLEGTVAGAGVPIDLRRSAGGDSALLLAATNGQAEVVALLLVRGAFTNLADDAGFTPLAMACQENHPAIVAMLIAGGAGAAESPGCGPAVLEHGARGDGSTPLIQAAQDESLAVMEALLVGKADVNATHDSTGATALIVAAEQGSADAVRLLLAHGADASIVSNRGNSALARAQAKGWSTSASGSTGGSVVELLKAAMEVSPAADPGHGKPRLVADGGGVASTFYTAPTKKEPQPEPEGAGGGGGGQVTSEMFGSAVATFAASIMASVEEHATAPPEIKFGFDDEPAGLTEEQEAGLATLLQSAAALEPERKGPTFEEMVD
jgi:hypothetical protein